MDALRKIAVIMVAYVISIGTTMAWGQGETDGYHEYDCSAGFVQTAENLNTSVYGLFKDED